MSRKQTLIAAAVVFIVAIGALIAVAWQYQDRLPGQVSDQPPTGNGTPGNGSQTADGTALVTDSSTGLSIPKGFKIEVLAKDLPGARDMVFDQYGNLWVSQTEKGTVSMVEIRNGKAIRQAAVFRNLKRPHGLALDIREPGWLYIAEEDKVSRAPLYSDGSPEKILDLPAGGRHFTRSLYIGPDDRLYVSIGSTCDVCEEKNSLHATIIAVDKDGKNQEVIARGLRNSVFMTTNPVDGRLWATEMGRDNLGDNLPPDEVNIIEKGKDYGWPICYGNNVHDNKFDTRQYIQNPCNGKIPAHIEIPAHSAPLGLAFVPEEGWPESYWLDLLVAYHGSLDPKDGVGYKIVRFKLDDKGNAQGSDDFITGWLKDGQASGRPAGLLIQVGGVLYISDDKAGIIYRLTYQQEGMGEQPDTPATTSDLIRVTNIKDNQTVSSPLTIQGEARGNWYFEATFPVKVVDANEKLVAQGYGQANGEWMTTNFVPFTAIVTFTPPATQKGTIIIENSNASGLPENARSIRIPVQFATTTQNQVKSSATGGCVISGCSSQLCGESEQVSTCEYTPQYACYKTAACERQPDGQCGWTPTTELLECLNNGGIE